jgi:hypothetical protein
MEEEEEPVLATGGCDGCGGALSSIGARTPVVAAGGGVGMRGAGGASKVSGCGAGTVAPLGMGTPAACMHAYIQQVPTRF